MDAGIGTDSGGAVDYDAAFVVNPNPTASANIIFTWAEEQALIGGSAPSISGVTLSGTPAAPTVTVTGSNLGSAPTTATTEPCGDTGNIYGASGLVFQDLTESWGAGGAGDCIGLFVTSWSSTKVVFTFDSEYASFGPIKAGDQIEVTILGATDTVTASFTTPRPPSLISRRARAHFRGNYGDHYRDQLHRCHRGRLRWGRAAKSFTFVSTTEITAVSPATGAAVARLIVVTTPSGTSANVPAADFTYEGAPTITNISPTRAQLQGALRSPLPGPTSPVSPRSPSVGPGQPRASRSSRAPRSPQYPRRPGLPWPV